MKALRITLTVIISFILVNLIVCLSAAISIKEVVQNELVGEVVKQSIISGEGKVDTQTIDNILSYDGTNEIINSVINDSINYLDNNKEVSDETIDLIVKFINDNKEDLEKLTGEKIDLNELNSQETRDEIKKSLNEELSEINIDDDSPIKPVIITYGKITSNNLKITLFIIIIILVTLLVLLSWSIYKWIKPLGIVLIISGTIVILVYLLSFTLANILKQALHVDIDINTSFILISGLCETVTGILLLIIYSVINKNINIQDNSYENTNQID